mmetsp:Transcript_37865/g.55353  ORF Transcript_37865/g.55353 Transcript_37865/m.55353 type:complete len:92 (-) Transcript_37865:559-834(-)
MSDLLGDVVSDEDTSVGCSFSSAQTSEFHDAADKFSLPSFATPTSATPAKHNKFSEPQHETRIELPLVVPRTVSVSSPGSFSSASHASELR